MRDPMRMSEFVQSVETAYEVARANVPGYEEWDEAGAAHGAVYVIVGGETYTLAEVCVDINIPILCPEGANGPSVSHSYFQLKLEKL